MDVENSTAYKFGRIFAENFMQNYFISCHFHINIQISIKYATSFTSLHHSNGKFCNNVTKSCHVTEAYFLAF